MSRVLAILAGALLPAIGIIIFAAGAQQSAQAAYGVASGQAGPGALLLLLLGAILLVAGVLSALWSGIGLAIAGGIGVLLGFLQFFFPIAAGSFIFSSWFVRGLLGFLPRQWSEALLTFFYLGGPLITGAILLGAGLGLEMRRRTGTIWTILVVGGALLGIVLVTVGQQLVVDMLRTFQSNPLQVVALLLGSVALAVAAFASRGAGLALLVIGGVIAALGVVGLLAPTLVAGASPLIRLPQQTVYLVAQGYPLLFGLLLAATGLAAVLIARRRPDAVLAPAV